jgi:hypothetical protein
MSRRTRPERRSPRGAGRGALPPARRRPASRAGLLAAMAVAIAAVALWATLRWRSPVTVPPGAATPLPGLVESIGVAEKAQDWPRLCSLLQRLARENPDNPSAQLALGLAWHNLAWMGAPSGRERSATRTSLDRIGMQKRVFALLDSAATRARTPAEWARAQYWSGMAYENLGLSTDALRIYTGVHVRQPGVTPALAHATALMRYLRDPQPPAAPAPAPAAMEPAQP